MKPLPAKTESLNTKLSELRKDTAERTLAALIYENAETITTFEEQIKSHVTLTAVFKAEQLDEATVDQVKAAIEKAATVAKEVKTTGTETY